ncbi:MAG: hypothetical protein P4L51_23895 [Puia sp.]|nr:hypothetical protein [Puia sp.]
MINDWLSYNLKHPPGYSSFRLIDVTEKVSPNTAIQEYLADNVLQGYRNLEHLRRLFTTLSEADLRSYLERKVFPADTTTLVRNVRQGDFGEILASLIVSYFEGLTVPIHKMRHKFNKDRSVFCTDMIAHNTGPTINDIYYYEIKTRQNIQLEGEAPNRHFVTVLAHNSLKKDEQEASEGIADFLVRLYAGQNDFDSAAKYLDIVLHPDNYSRKFELYIIVEKSKYKIDILTALDSLPPSLIPLGVTVVLIEHLDRLVKDIYALVSERTVHEIFPPSV